MVSTFRPTLDDLINDSGSHCACVVAELSDDRHNIHLVVTDLKLSVISLDRIAILSNLDHDVVICVVRLSNVIILAYLSARLKYLL